MIKSLSIIFPLYNEEQRLQTSFNHILNFIKKKPAFKKQHSEKKKYAMNLKEVQKQEKETSCMEKPKVVAKEKGSKFFLKNNLKRSIVLSEILKTKY